MKITISYTTIKRIREFTEKHTILLLVILLGAVSLVSSLYYSHMGLSLAYNDARSHLDMGRRVVESLKPGLAQLGSVWLPLPHLLMLPTVWNNWFWHTGASGTIQSMASFIITGVIIYLFLKQLGVNMLGRLVGVAVFTINLNILYMQSTPMTELLLIVSMTAGVYDLLRWEQTDELLHLVRSSFWIMLATLNRYDGWFLFICMIGIIGIISFMRHGLKAAEGKLVMFCTMAGIGIAGWLLWNTLIFHNPLYFAFGPYSAHAQQMQLSSEGYLSTKKNIVLSFESYFFAMVYDSNLFVFLISVLGGVLIFLDKNLRLTTKLVLLTLFAPFVFNILALYLGQSALFIQGISGGTWFNVRYGIVMIPSLAILTGYFISRIKHLRYVVIGIMVLVSVFMFTNQDAVTIDDARYGKSQINFVQVTSWLHDNVSQEEGLVLLSVAKNDPVAFSSGLPMSRFITEGTGKYWDGALTHPSHWARWVVTNTTDNTDLVYQKLSKLPEFKQEYVRVAHFYHDDIYELKPEYVYKLSDLARSGL